MKRLKTFGLYIFWLILFFVFSRVIIFIGLNNTYNNIELRGDVPQGISIFSAKATSVNGEIKGKVFTAPKLKYIKFNFYTDIDTLAGSYYLHCSKLENNNFEFYFKLNYIESYSIELTDEIPENAVNTDDFSSEEFKNSVILGALIYLMFL